MREITIAAVTLAATLLAMTIYVSSHPPDVSSNGVRWLRRGLRLGLLSSATVLAMISWIHSSPPLLTSAFWSRMLPALAGNVLNLIALVYCLRELSAEGLLSALLVGFNQLFWLLVAIRSLADF
jgi:hypothetical protein